MESWFDDYLCQYKQDLPFVRWDTTATTPEAAAANFARWQALEDRRLRRRGAMGAPIGATPRLLGPRVQQQRWELELSFPDGQPPVVRLQLALASDRHCHCDRYLGCPSGGNRIDGNDGATAIFWSFSFGSYGVKCGALRAVQKAAEGRRCCVRS